MDFERARYNMVEQQIRPWDVLDFKLLDVLQELPREEFVTEEQK
ncbi:MAG: protein-L-isoaspartate O-methyltransferase, partial [Neisseriaceae bacterium]|nr:protein-L-isoaspartate O-methyltransferase [Neisseriaceae bacterium]